MKTKISIFSILLIAFAIIFNSCKKDDVQDAVNTFFPNSFKVDGQLIQFIATISYSNTTQTFNVKGVSPSGEMVLLVFGKDVKTYTISPTVQDFSIGCTGVFKLSESATAIYGGYEGSIVISKADLSAGKVTGTFNFKARTNLTDPAKSITEGNFNNF